MVREVHAGFQNKEKEAGSRCALGGFTPFFGTQAPQFPNTSSPRGLGSSLGRGLWLLSISYDKSKASNLMLLICRLIRLRVCQRPQRWAGAGHGTWLWALSTPSPCWQLPVKQNGWEQKCWGEIAAQMPWEYKCLGGRNSQMMSLLTSHSSHFSKRAVSVPDCFGWRLLIA